MGVIILFKLKINQCHNFLTDIYPPLSLLMNMEFYLKFEQNLQNHVYDRVCPLMNKCVSM